MPFASYLDRRIACRDANPQRGFDADDPFRTDHGDLGARTILHRQDQRAEHAAGEQDVLQWFIAFVENLPASQCYGHQLRSDARTLVFR